MSATMQFDAMDEAEPGRKWAARWRDTWPAYEAWFRARGGDAGPSRIDCEDALARHMPELIVPYRQLTTLAGGGDRAARFLSGWRPPTYLGGCSIAARAQGGEVRLVRNYDLSPELNEGLLWRSALTNAPVMGMVEFLWGLSDGVNARGLSVALAYGGSSETGAGFGVTHILRYLLETCGTVDEALAALRRIPSHMAYNVTLADRFGATATAELQPGGGVVIGASAVAANHQSGARAPDRAARTQTYERLTHLADLLRQDIAPADLAPAFLKQPLRQTDYAGAFGTLFTAEYDPKRGALTLHWPEQTWTQRIDDFTEGRREIVFEAAPDDVDPATAMDPILPYLEPRAADALRSWSARAKRNGPDWAGLASVFAAGPRSGAGASSGGGETRADCEDAN